MQAVQMSSRFARGLASKALVKPQVITPSIIRYKSILTPEQMKKRDEYREKMQYPDDTPVYLRGGAFDRVLFTITCGLVGTSVGMVFYRVYKRANA